jgi:hypothetical protein
MNKKTMLIGLGVLAVAGIGYYMWKKKNETTSGACGCSSADGEEEETNSGCECGCEETTSNAKGDTWAWGGTGGCPYGYTKITSGPDAGWCVKKGGGAISNPMGGGRGKGGFAMTRG